MKSPPDAGLSFCSGNCLFNPDDFGYFSRMAERLQKGAKILRGIAVSDGVCRGKILVLHRTHHIIARHEISADEAAGETGRFEKALVQTRQEILEVQRKVVENLGAKEADIFEAHLLMLEDHALVGEVIRLIKEEKVNAEFAFHTVAERYAEALLAANDEYLRERATDMRDLTSRVLDNLLEVKDAFDLHHIAEPCILVSHDLSPSTTAQLNKKFVLGFATDIGGKTSHTAIMARSLGIPAVVGLQTASQELDSGDYALLDGYSGTIIINPTDQTLFEYGQLAKIKASLDEKLREIQAQPAVTLDGKSIHLSANIEDQNDIEAVIANGAEGVGLFRTEFLFINRDSLPSEEEQYKVYREVAAALKPQLDHHPHARPGRRQICLAPATGAGDESVSRLAGDPVLPGAAGIVPRPAPRHSPRQRRGQRENDVSHDFRPGRIEPGQRHRRKMQGRIARRRQTV